MDKVWITVPIILIAAIVTVGIWGRLFYSGMKRRSGKEIVRSFTVLVSFFAWFALVALQNWGSADFQIYTMTETAGYVILPFALIALWRFVSLHIGNQLHHVLGNRKYRILFTGILILYGVFYLFVSGIVVSPEVVDVNPNGFFVIYFSRGILAVWPSAGFGWPTVGLAGSMSLDAGLIFLTVTTLMGITIILLVYGWRLSANRQFCMKGVSGTVGSSMGIAAVSFSCCSLPVLYPLLLLLFNTATAEYLSSLMLNESGMLFNVLQMTVLSLMAMTTIFIADRVKRIDSNACKI